MPTVTFCQFTNTLGAGRSASRRMTGREPASRAAAADSIISTEEALRQHKEWLVNFRRDMSLVALNTAPHPVPTEH